jgi:DNA repair protein RecO (recombination protein O)
LIAEREENRAIFTHLKEGLCHLEQQGPSLRFVTSYELKVLRLAGYQPVLDRCKACGAEIQEQGGARWYFSSVDGGVFCGSCAGGRRELVPLGANAAKMLTLLQKDESPPVSPVLLSARVVHEMRATVSSFIQYHVNREIRSAPFLRGYSTL